MKKKTLGIGIVCGLFVLLVAGMLFLTLSNPKQKKTSKKEEVNINMLSAYTDEEIYAGVPAVEGESIKYGRAEDYGKKNWILDVNGVTPEEYQNYLDSLEQAGFVKHSESTEDAVDGYVKAAAFTKDTLTLTLSYVVQGEKLCICDGYGWKHSGHSRKKGQ